MIEVRTHGQSLAARLADKAQRLGEASAARRALARRDDDRRWRKPALLWPLYMKD